MKLSALFSNGMVLQRGQKNCLWGYTNPGLQLNGIFGARSFQASAGANGYFEAELPDLPAGGPYELQIDADETVVIRDIMIGDVFLLGGQSNMELPLARTVELFDEELERTSEPEIRMFEVAKEYEFAVERSELYEGNWQPAQGKSLMNFSAAGYFTAKELKDRYKIPIGLIQTAVGGTPAKAWCSEATIRQMGLYTEELDRCKVPGYPQQVEAAESRREQAWLAAGTEAFSGRAVQTGIVDVPGIWKTNELKEFRGAIRLTKKINLSAEEAGKELELVLGAIVDADKVYINGSYIGETGYKYPPRFYAVPNGILREGENTIEIQMFVFRGKGGFMPGKQYGLREKNNRRLLFCLTGAWNYEIMKEMEALPETTFFTYQASALYNGMLTPLKKWKICAALYYQGESNTGKPDGYAEEMKALITDWRALWNWQELPFIYVQLAGFSDGEIENQGTEWAYLRAEQEKASSIPQTAMVAAYDLGEYNDLHPFDKKTLGERLALAVRSLVYGETLVWRGPRAESARLETDGTVHVRFDSARGGLCAGRNQTETEVMEVELAEETGSYQKAHAVIQGTELLAVSQQIKRPASIRYAWRDCPTEANLYNKEGLPAYPFLIRVVTGDRME